MRCSLLVLLLALVLGPASVLADERAPPTPAKPLSAEQGADVVLASLAAKDTVAIEKLAARLRPSPWLVADELRRRGKQDAAETFAASVPGKEGVALVQHVETWRGTADPVETRKALAAMETERKANRFAEVLALTDKTPGTPGSMLAIRIAMVRGYALRGLRRLEVSATTLLAAADAAEKLGWTYAQATGLLEAAKSRLLRSDMRGALAAFERLLPVLEARQDNDILRRVLTSAAGIHQRLGAPHKTAPLLERAIDLTEALGHKAQAAMLLGTVYDVHRKLGNTAAALRCAERAVALEKEVGNAAGQARRLADVGHQRAALGEFTRALAAHQRSLFLFEQLGDKNGISVALGNIGGIHRQLGDPVTALSFQQRSLKLAQELGDTFGVAAIYVSIGNARFGFGDYLQALRDYRGALDLFWKLRKKSASASALSSIGIAYEALGEYAKALYYGERALAMFEELGEQEGVATALGNLGNVHETLGDHDRARTYLSRALALYEKLGHKPSIAQQLDNLGYLFDSIGEYEQALAHFQRALAIHEEVLDKRGMANVFDNIGNVHAHRKEYAKALEYQQRALALWEPMKDRAKAATTLALMGETKARMGQRTEALEALQRAAREARSRRLGPLLVWCLRAIARIHLEANNLPLAMSHAQQALSEVERLLGRLGEEQGALARSGHTEVFEIGALAAARAGDTAAAVTFLESGRAGSLLESLGGRSSLRWEDLPKELRRAESVADAQEAHARAALRKATKTGNVSLMRERAKALESAADRVADVAARIQREVKGRARDFLYPRADTAEQIQERLQPGQALVLYGLCLDEALALVLTRKERRVVFLGKASVVRAACAALDLTHADADGPAHVAPLRKLLVEPLALKKGVKEVLVSPEGPLCYVPFAALFDRVVAFTPSGSTHGMLSKVQSGGGRDVLALGDPDYTGIEEGSRQVYVRGRELARLPATRPEAEAVGDDVLLGAKANETELRKALAKHAHWRAVHFACHGLVDHERPTLSSLALSATKQEDGFLTALEVLRMDVPADLVVLSACETGTGRIVKGEGIVGLTRAFMYAGAPRVICSLWRVDDEATRVLMTKFYALWNPKVGEALPAAVALQKAQQYVKGHDKWKHPYYWAAWVLWGLAN